MVGPKNTTGYIQGHLRPVNCENCGEEFLAKRGTIRACSKECRSALIKSEVDEVQYCKCGCGKKLQKNNKSGWYRECNPSYKKSKNYCKCGCGKLVRKDSVDGIRAECARRIAQENKTIRYCKCGCGVPVSPTSKDGYLLACSPNNYNKYKSKLRYCACGCGGILGTRNTTGYLVDCQPKPTCLCGCGEELPLKNKSGYIDGHLKGTCPICESTFTKTMLLSDKEEICPECKEENRRLISSNIERSLQEYFPDFERDKRIGGYFPDYVNEEKKIIIEFNGDYWHMNPNKYKSDDVNTTSHKTAAEIWQKEKERTEKLESLGYKVIVLWENDYLQDPVKAIEQVFSNF
jgi:very-short-patch-repair endonuclease